VRQTLSKGLVVAAAATSALSLCGTWASADSGPRGTAVESPAALLGNTVQSATPDEPDALKSVLGGSTPGYGTDDSSGYGAKDTSGYGADHTSGYGAEEPSGKPSCGCDDSPTPTPSKATTPPPKTTPSPTPVASKTPPVTPTPREFTPPPKMAETGAESVLAATAASGALLAAGTILYRRGRTASRR
jgi:hypothetical protein